MIEKFTIAGREVESEFLDLNHTSDSRSLLSLLISMFALGPSIELGRTSKSGH